ncbi:MAG: glycosyltransferase [Saprospiraceae bacterium]|nr:glycosyltransferase [Saprospiraceae bacterium]
MFSITYGYLLIVYRRGWKALPTVRFQKDFDEKTSITVLIPARNEAGNMEACLRSVLGGSYPHNLLEVIVLDDFSEDKTAEIVQQLSESLIPKKSGSGSSISCIRLADQLPPEARFQPNKKKAIQLGVARAKGEIIVTTDADCIVPKDWLRHIAYAFENAPIKMVCGPVVFHHENNLLQRFQSLDFLGLMGITGAGYPLGWHQMANGANLAYRKEAFEAVNGYAGNEHLASGDDMFLVQKVAKRWPGSIAFLKNSDATVLTEAAPGLHSFWQQRLRWGTKNAALPNWPLRLSLLTVFLFCWSIWINLAFIFFYLWTDKAYIILWIFLFQIAVKAFFDYVFLSEMCRFFNRKDLLRWFWPSFFMHTAYIPLVGTASIFMKKYQWKGRRAN